MILTISGPRNTTFEIVEKDVLYSPHIGVTLIAISKLTQNGYMALFTADALRILDKNKKVIG